MTNDNYTFDPLGLLELLECELTAAREQSTQLRYFKLTSVVQTHKILYDLHLTLDSTAMSKKEQLKLHLRKKYGTILNRITIEPHQDWRLYDCELRITR